MSLDLYLKFLNSADPQPHLIQSLPRTPSNHTPSTYVPSFYHPSPHLSRGGELVYSGVPGDGYYQNHPHPHQHHPHPHHHPMPFHPSPQTPVPLNASYNPYHYPLAYPSHYPCNPSNSSGYQLPAYVYGPYHPSAYNAIAAPAAQQQPPASEVHVRVHSGVPAGTHPGLW
jgi:hypothetical protein